MSVYTPVSTEQLKAWLESYDLSPLRDFHGITSGIVNTNYFVNTADSEFVLTLFETLSASEVPYFLALMAFFAEHDVPSPHPRADRDGRYMKDLCGKPAALVQKLAGTSVLHPGPGDCRAIGTCLARMHRTGLAFGERRVNPQGLDWWQSTAERIYPLVGEQDRQLLRAQLDGQANFSTLSLPRGVIHGDLFRDNALFVARRLSGVLDFYFACDELFVYDLAITVIDWCVTADARIDYDKARAMTGAYRDIRSVEAPEIRAWPMMLQAACLRWWLARLLDQHFPRGGAITQQKDPEVFKRRVQRFAVEDRKLLNMWD